MRSLFLNEICIWISKYFVQVFVGKTVCGTVTYEIGQSVYVVDCGSPIVGEIVKVSLDGDYLTLCEVEILGKFL